MVQLVKNPPAMQRPWFNSCIGKIHWKRDRLPIPVFCQRIPWTMVRGFTKSQTRLRDFHFSSGDSSGKELTCQCRRLKRHSFNPWIAKIPWRRAWRPTSVLLPENPLDKGACWAINYVFAWSDTTEATYHTAHTSYL